MLQCDDSRWLQCGSGNQCQQARCYSPRPFFSGTKRPPDAAMSEDVTLFSRLTIEQVEEGHELAPKFDAEGLIPCVTTAAASGEVLMLGYMNREAFTKTITTGEAHYYSRSRKLLWHKGATSGLVQKVVEMRIDDDQDAVWLRVEIPGDASCHVGYRSCFYRSIPTGDGGTSAGKIRELKFEESEKMFDPKKVYGDAPNPTIL
jgi:phosphoribosyl-AMP cyclohydrolase